jgi:hypothetical protein
MALEGMMPEEVFIGITPELSRNLIHALANIRSRQPRDGRFGANPTQLGAPHPECAQDDVELIVRQTVAVVD